MFWARAWTIVEAAVETAVRANITALTWDTAPVRIIAVAMDVDRPPSMTACRASFSNRFAAYSGIDWICSTFACNSCRIALPVGVLFNSRRKAMPISSDMERHAWIELVSTWVNIAQAVRVAQGFRVAA